MIYSLVPFFVRMVQNVFNLYVKCDYYIYSSILAGCLGIMIKNNNGNDNQKHLLSVSIQN